MSLRCNAANDANGSAFGKPFANIAASKYGGGFLFACLPACWAFEFDEAMTARVTPRPKQGQLAARVGKKKSAPKDAIKWNWLFRKVGSNLNAHIG